MKSITASVVRAIGFCATNAWQVIGLSLLLAVLSTWYAATHFSMTTDINQLISPNIDWRQREARFEKAFPQFQLIVAVVDAPTPELVDAATSALVHKLEPQMKVLGQAQRLVQVLAGDPSLRGVIQAFQLSLLGVQGGQLTLDNMQ